MALIVYHRFLELIKDKLFTSDIKKIFKITKLFWKKNDNKVFFLTGCTGFFGIWIVSTFNIAIQNLKLNIKVFVLTRDKKIKKKIIYKISKNKNIKFIYGNILNFKVPNSIKKIDYIIHGATTSALETFNKQNYNLKKKIIIDGTKKILRLAKKKKCKNFFYMSSGAVYKNLNKNALLNEKSKTYSYFKLNSRDDDKSVLGKSKRKAEIEVINFCKKNKISFSIGRFFSFIGPFMPMNIHYAIGNFLIAKLLKKEIKLNSSGKSVRSFMYISDCIIHIFFILFNQKSGAIYNIGSDEKISILELSRLINKILPGKVDININNKDNSKSFYVPSIKKLKKSFPGFAYINLRDAIKKTFLHLKINKRYYLR